MNTLTNSPASDVAAGKTKIAYIDRLRVLMTILVIIHHSAVTYGAPGGWYLSDASTNAGTQIALTWFVATDQSFFMGFFFFLSALFTPGAYDKKGPVRFLADRLKRLGIPLLVYSFIISPITIWLVLKYQGGVKYRFTDFLKGFDGWIDFGVLWFVAALLLFTFIYAAARRVFPVSKRTLSFPGRWRIFFFAAGVALITYLVRIVFPVGRVLKPLGFQPAHFSQYIALYVLGLIAARNNWPVLLPVTNNRFWTRLSLGLIFIGFPSLYLIKVVTGAELPAFTGGPGLPSLLNALWEQLTGFSIIMALAGRFRVRDRPPGSLLYRLVRSSFAVYIIHPLVLVSISLLALHWPVGPEIKLPFVAAAAVALSFMAGILVVKIPGVNRVV